MLDLWGVQTDTRNYDRPMLSRLLWSFAAACPCPTLAVTKAHVSGLAAPSRLPSSRTCREPLDRAELRTNIGRHRGARCGRCWPWAAERAVLEWALRRLCRRQQCL